MFNINLKPRELNNAYLVSWITKVGDSKVKVFIGKDYKSKAKEFYDKKVKLYIASSVFLSLVISSNRQEYIDINEDIIQEEIKPVKSMKLAVTPSIAIYKTKKSWSTNILGLRPTIILNAKSKI